jgi:hypothetical protein
MKEVTIEEQLKKLAQLLSGSHEEALAGATKAQANMIKLPEEFAKLNIEGAAFMSNYAGKCLPKEKMVNNVVESLGRVEASEEIKKAIAWLAVIGGVQLHSASSYFERLKERNQQIKQLVELIGIISIAVGDTADPVQKQNIDKLVEYGESLTEELDSELAKMAEVDANRRERAKSRKI